MQIKHLRWLPVIVSMCSLLSCTATKAPASNTAPLVFAKDSSKAFKDEILPDTSITDPFMLQLLQQYPQYFSQVLANRTSWNVQIIYTQVNRGANGIAALTHHYFNVDAGRYFYPASTVKFPVSILALQRINELKQYGIDKNTTMLTEAAYSGQTAVYNDATTPNGKPSIAHYIKKILMVSDNDAYNRLFEFLGPRYINEQLHQKGYTTAQLLHRLQAALSKDENRHTNPVKFLDAANKVLYQQPMQVDETVYASRNDSLGKAYYAGDQLINHPMDCAGKNRLSLPDLHQILISLVFPNKVTAAQRFNISDDDRNFLLKYMSQLPTESTYPPYADDTASYYPAYCKFLLYGAQKGPLPANLRIFNKVGDAYGQLLDVAYIVDFDKGVEFFLSAVLYCNNDGVLNDDAYNYDDIGLPFMKHLGEVIYEYEKKREKKQQPDLSNLRFVYDK
ncbi:MAG: hypothetical protein RL172_120 [Bacteroidota bacterium]|jgi:beta-lactamase class A